MPAAYDATSNHFDAYMTGTCGLKCTSEFTDAVFAWKQKHPDLADKFDGLGIARKDELRKPK